MAAQSWWVLGWYNSQNKLESFYVQAATAPSYDGSQKYGGQTIVSVNGPYPTKAAAEAFAAKTNGKSAPSDLQALTDQAGLGFPGFNLLASGFAGWFARGLKLIFGGILMIVGISHLAGLSNQVTQMVGKAAPYLAV